jgi:hypothetical protein
VAFDDDALSSAGATETDDRGWARGTDGLELFSSVNARSASGGPSFATTSVGSAATSAVTVLPTSHGWSRMITRQVSSAGLQAARKYGHCETQGGHSRIYRHLGIAYVTDESGRVCITCWKEKLTPEDLLTGPNLRVRTCKGREGCIIGTDEGLLQALQAQYGATVQLLIGTGHVVVSGEDFAVDQVMSLLDDLLIVKANLHADGIEQGFHGIVVAGE